jgi:hypothetical protein
MGKIISKEALTQDIISVKTKLGKIPSLADYVALGQFHKETIRRRFGSWNNALQLCFNQVVRLRPPPRKIIACVSCNKPTKNHKFCSMSCAAIHNNPLYHRKQKICEVCNLNKGYSTSKVCRDCFLANKTKNLLEKIQNYGERAIGSFKSTYARHRYQNIRHHAHKLNDCIYHLPKQCQICGYDTHVELCHIKPINDFHPDTKLSVVNSKENLVFMCRNHHWELENGIILYSFPSSVKL